MSQDNPWRGEMSKHTPLPWKVDASYYRESPLIVSDNKIIAQLQFGGQSREERNANSEFIVNACNNHYELLEACKWALTELKLTNRIKDTVKDLEQAISKAEKTNE